jgi:DNA-binding Lrp family transcriptional regulator
LKLDAIDVKVLEAIQRDSKRTTAEIARELGIPVTTVYSKIRRLENLKLIKGYHALLDGKKLGKSTTAFILVTVSYATQSQDLDREVANQVSQFGEVQEVHLVSGEWDFIIKLRSSNIESVGKFIAEKLRTVKGIDRTVTCLVFETAKETTEIDLKQPHEDI